LAADSHTHHPLILLAGGEEVFARSLASVLGNGAFEVAQVGTGREALDEARKRRPDAIILDLGLPDMDGFATCRALRAEAAVTRATPIVLMTLGPATRTQQLEALRAGAWELRGQPLDTEELLLRLTAYVQGKVELDRLGAEGLVDPASGLYNATGIARRSEELASLTARQGLPLACVVFQPSNGGAPDDFARAFKIYGRVSDAIGRTGPAEFAVFAPATDAPGAAQLVERLADTVGRAMKAPRLRAGYSAAAATAATPRISPQQLLARARAALDAARATRDR